VHSLERDEKAGVFPADDFQGAARIVSAIHQKGTANGIGNFRGDAFLPRIHSGSADSTCKVGFLTSKKVQEGLEIGGIILAIPVHHSGIRAGSGE
jgi:hypothetical protein